MEWEAADDEALCFELGIPEVAGILDERIRTIRAEHGGRILLIGGPPCQAYSLVGRARNVGKAGYKAGLGHRNFLYDEYFTVLTVLSPAAFVIENGNGMLPATVRGSAIFSQVMADLRAAGGPAACELFALSGSSAQMPGSEPRCLIPWFDGAILSTQLKESLWDKFVMGAPRPRTLSEQQYSDRKLRSRR